MDFSQFADKEVKEPKVIPEKSASGTNNTNKPSNDIPLKEADSKGDGFGTVELARKVLAAPNVKSATELVKKSQGFGAIVKPIEDTSYKPTESIPAPQPKITKREEVINEHFDIIIPEQREEIQLMNIPTKQQAAMYLDLYNFVKQKVVNHTDYQTIKGKKFLKKSGWRKFINAFKISIELISEEVFQLKVDGNDDTHAKVRVRATLLSGQSVEGIGIKSMSKLFEKTLHNLISTAWTRAVNRAVSDLVGFGEVSAEEVDNSGGGFGA